MSKIPENIYIKLSGGYADKTECYDDIRAFYSDMPGITAYYVSEEKLWYIVQSKTLAKLG